MPIVRLLKCIFKAKKTCFKIYGVRPGNDAYEINNDKLSFLIGISYNDILNPPLHIQPKLLNCDDLMSELDLIPFAIVLTTCSSPFLIKYVNKQWESMCGYKSVDVIDKTFSVIQGNNPENVNTTKQFKNSVTMSLASWRLMLFLTLSMLISPTDSIFAKIKRICKFSYSQKCFGFSKMDKINVQFPIQQTYLGKSLFVRP